MENVRLRVNRDIIKFVVDHGGKAIKHHAFNDKSPSLFVDNCHLSFIGNDIFLNSFQAALESFIHHPETKLYPLMGH